jgi:hypothetical protein
MEVYKDMQQWADICRLHLLQYTQRQMGLTADAAEIVVVILVSYLFFV